MFKIMLNTKLPFVAAIFVALVSVSLAQEEMQCRGQPLKLTDKQKGQITECLDAVGIKTVWKIPIDKLACFGVCVMEKKDLLTPEGKINHEKSLKYIEMVAPDEFKKPLIDGIDKCIKEHGDKVKMDGDKNCVTFMEVGQCVHDVFLDICVED